VNASQSQLQQQISEARKEGSLRVRIWANCQVPTCPVMEFSLKVAEGPTRKAMQAPVRCPRCMNEAVFDELEGL
jgi:hypothetical protein